MTSSFRDSVGVVALGFGLLTACAVRPPSTPDRTAQAAAPFQEEDRVVEATSSVAEGFEVPIRLQEDAAMRVEPPAMPAALAAPPELTVELVTTSTAHSQRVERRQDVARTADRIHVRVVDAGVEWLFVRNPVDPRRVSARRVDHARRVIVEYDESELQLNGIARGWADVAGLGVEHDALQELMRSGRTRNHFGFEFVEWRSKPGVPAREIWWSDEAALPLHISGLPSDSTVVIVSVRRDVERTRLLEPLERFHDYSVMDVADYREKHHEGSSARRETASPLRSGHSHP
jgi:hypothetical protein